MSSASELAQQKRKLWRALFLGRVKKINSSSFFLKKEVCILLDNSGAGVLRIKIFMKSEDTVGNY